VDDPLQKAAHWIREGARLFDIHSDHFGACSRWISLFGLRPEQWPPELWYNLALLLPSLQHLAATEPGTRLIFELLLELPLKEMRFTPSVRSLPQNECTLLADRWSRLGVDCILGNRVEDLASIVLVVGPVSLATYYDYQREEKRRLLDAVLDLCLSCRWKSRISWLVSNSEQAPRLGYEERNARLGINSHLGQLAS
jgi:predicted component of type VI protein secretion system